MGAGYEPDQSIPARALTIADAMDEEFTRLLAEVQGSAPGSATGSAGSGSPVNASAALGSTPTLTSTSVPGPAPSTRSGARLWPDPHEEVEAVDEATGLHYLVRRDPAEEEYSRVTDARKYRVRLLRVDAWRTALLGAGVIRTRELRDPATADGWVAAAEAWNPQPGEQGIPRGDWGRTTLLERWEPTVGDTEKSDRDALPLLVREAEAPSSDSAQSESAQSDTAPYDDAPTSADDAVTADVARAGSAEVESADFTPHLEIGVGNPALPLNQFSDCLCDACDSGSAYLLQAIDEVFISLLAGAMSVEEGYGFSKHATLFGSSSGSAPVHWRERRAAKATPTVRYHSGPWA